MNTSVDDTVRGGVLWTNFDAGSGGEERPLGTSKSGGSIAGQRVRVGAGLALARSRIQVFTRLGASNHTFVRGDVRKQGGRARSHALSRRCQEVGEVAAQRDGGVTRECIEVLAAHADTVVQVEKWFARSHLR